MKKHLFLIITLLFLGVSVSHVDAQALRVFISAQLAPDPIAGYVLSTDGTNSEWIPAAGGGSSKWTDNGTTITPTSNESIIVNGTSTLQGLITSSIQASTSAGLIVYSNNGTQIVDFGAGGGSNATFSGGVNINGQTRLATSLTGILRADAGVVSTNATGSLTENVAGLEIIGAGELIGSSSVINLTSGFIIPTSTLLTNLSDFYQTPSTRITAGIGLSWLGNTLSATGTVNSGTQGQVAWYPTTGTSISGTSTITIATTTGFVGIGSSTPGSMIAINGTSTAIGYRASGITATRAVFTNATSDLVPQAASAALLNSLSDETGTGIAVFATSPTITTPTFTTRATTAELAGGSAVSSVLTLKSTTGAGTSDSINFVVGNNGATHAMRIQTTGNVNIATTTLSLGTSTATTSRLTVAGASGGTIATFMSNIGTAFMTMLNTGVTTLLGSWDFGGADSLEIPNGTANTVDAIGEIALDTTDNQLLIATSTASGAPAVIPTMQSLGSFLIASTSQPFTTGFVTGVAIPFKVHRDGYTVQEIHCDVDGGTSIVINFDNGTGNTSTLTCDTDGASLIGVGSNGTVTAGSVSTAIETGTVTGVVNYLRVSVYGAYTRE